MRIWVNTEQYQRHSVQQLYNASNLIIHDMCWWTPSNMQKRQQVWQVWHVCASQELTRCTHTVNAYVPTPLEPYPFPCPPLALSPCKSSTSSHLTYPCLQTIFQPVSNALVYGYTCMSTDQQSPWLLPLYLIWPHDVHTALHSVITCAWYQAWTQTCSINPVKPTSWRVGCQYVFFSTNAAVGWARKQKTCSNYTPAC